MGGHDYSRDGGRRFYCYYNETRYYMACHKRYESDIFDQESAKLLFHSNHTLRGENFSFESFENGRFRLYYRDGDDYNLKNYMLFIHKQQDMNNFTPVFHKNKCSEFILENTEENNKYYIKETGNNVYLYLNRYRKRDSNGSGTSYYAGATLERNRATKFEFIDISNNI